MGISRRQLLVLGVVLAAVGIWLYRAPAETPARFPMPQGRTYVMECGSCHTAYPPGFLPTRSWRVMMAGLDDHFGEDASLEEPHFLGILKDLETYASDAGLADVRMRRISESIAASETPQRISQLPYFRHLHDEIDASLWQRKQVGSKANCIACHVQANTGSYAEREVRIP